MGQYRPDCTCSTAATIPHASTQTICSWARTTTTCWTVSERGGPGLRPRREPPHSERRRTASRVIHSAAGTCTSLLGGGSVGSAGPRPTPGKRRYGEPVDPDPPSYPSPAEKAPPALWAAEGEAKARLGREAGRDPGPGPAPLSRLGLWGEGRRRAPLPRPRREEDAGDPRRSGRTGRAVPAASRRGDVRGVPTEARGGAARWGDVRFLLPDEQGRGARREFSCNQ